MRNVFARGSYLLALVFASTLVGCSKASTPDISLFSQALPGLTWTWEKSPMDQSMQTQGYVMFKGECSATVTGLELQLNDENWKTIPSVAVSPGGRGTAPSGATWNADCTNGQFQFWVFESTIADWFPALFGGGQHSDVSVVRLRATVLGAPAAGLEFFDSNSHGGSGLPADHVAIRSWNSPLASIGADSCASFEAYLADANGNSTTTDHDVTITVKKSIDGSAVSDANVMTDSSCGSATTPVFTTNLTIPSSGGYVHFYYKPTAHGDVSASLSAAVSASFSAVSSLSGTAPTFAFSINPSSSKYLDFNFKSSIVQGLCYPFSVSMRTFDQSNVTASAAIPLIFSTPGISIYSSNDCSGAELTGGQIAAGANTSQRYSMRAGTAVNQVQIGVRAGTTSETVLPGSQNLYVAKASDAGTPSRIVLEGSSMISPAGEAFLLRMESDNYVSVPWPSGSSIDLSAVDGWGQSHGYFCLSAACTAAEQISSVSAADGLAGRIIYYKPTSGGRVSILASLHGGTSIASASRVATIYDLMERLVFTGTNVAMTSQGANPTVATNMNSAVTSGTCVDVNLVSYGYSADGTYGPVAVSSATTLSFISPPANVSYFKGSSCYTPNDLVVSGQTLSISAGTSSAAFSFRILNAGVTTMTQLIRILPNNLSYPAALNASVLAP